MLFEVKNPEKLSDDELSEYAKALADHYYLTGQRQYAEFAKQALDLLERRIFGEEQDEMD